MNRDEIKTLIFDLDGVITSEMKYWNTARLTVWEIISGDRYLAIKNYFGHPSDIPNVLVESSLHTNISIPFVFLNKKEF
jgi:beta-phosphoglucomutase-like phosphatase (HAD superfamily)